MRILRFSAFVLIVSSLIVPGILASGFENTAVGTTARATSGAFRAIANDWSAAYYNPAGYADVYDNQLGFNAAFVHHRNQLNPDYTYPGGSGWSQPGIFNGHDINNFHEVLSNPSLGAVFRLPVWGETVFGLSVYQPFDYNITWELYQHPDAYNNTLNAAGDQYRNNLDVVAFQATAARKFMEEKLSVGVGLQLLRADLLYNDILFRRNPFWDRLAEFGLQTQNIEKITELASNDGNGYGFGIRTGALYQLNEKTRLALTANVPFNINVSGTAVLNYDMPFLPYLPYGAIEFNIGQPMWVFTNGSRVADTADFEATLDLPPSIGAGVAYQHNDKLLLALDAEYTFWSDYEGLQFEYTNHHGLSTSVDSSDAARQFLLADISRPVDWSDAIKLMGGVTYEVSSLVTLMGGASIDQSPARANDMISPQLVDTGTKVGFSGGFTFHIQQWDLGFASSYVKGSDLTVSQLTDLDDDGSFDNFAGTYKAETYETVLSINYRF
ncbi:MAG: outer membrane protein transport protein [bacterium]|nr:outer membrane protein transport protein [bacterium]